MAKIIKIPSSQVYHIKALIPYWDLSFGGVDEKSPYRILALEPDTALPELGKTVLNAFNFDHDHLFGFYDNLKRYSNSKVCYEDARTIDYDNDMDDIFSQGYDKATYRMDDYCVSDIFTRKGQKWLMLFDYGDEWHFWLTMEGKEPINPKTKYPRVVKTKYKAPEQYPDYEDED